MQQPRSSQTREGAEPDTPSAADARRAARMQQTSREAARSVQEVTGLESPEQALVALDIVVKAIVQRITPTEANDFVSQLPSEYKQRWLDLPAGPDKSITRDSVTGELARHFRFEMERADDLLRRVGMALTDLVSEGELDQVRGQLPQGFREILWSSSVTPEG
jgi:uncharacterized protein (DUF2267 family)